MAKNKQHRIFDKHPKLVPSAMAKVADRRYADARALFDLKKNAHNNGAAYLAGFAIEILLKAKLVKKYGPIANKPQHLLKDDERFVWGLIWRSHDLAAMLEQLSDLEHALSGKGAWSKQSDCWVDLKSICAIWTIQARYSTHTIPRSDAEEFLKRVERVREYLK